MYRITDISSPELFRINMDKSLLKLCSVNKKIFELLKQNNFDAAFQELENIDNVFNEYITDFLNPNYIIYELMIRIARKGFFDVSEFELLKTRKFVDDIRRDGIYFVITYKGKDYRFKPLITILDKKELQQRYLNNSLDNLCHIISFENMLGINDAIKEKELPLQDRILVTGTTCTYNNSCFLTHSWIENSNGIICYDLSHNLMMPKTDFYNLLEVEFLSEIEKSTLDCFLCDIDKMEEKFNLRNFCINPIQEAQKYSLVLRNDDLSSSEKEVISSLCKKIN